MKHNKTTLKNHIQFLKTGRAEKKKHDDTDKDGDEPLSKKRKKLNIVKKEGADNVVKTEEPKKIKLPEDLEKAKAQKKKLEERIQKWKIKIKEKVLIKFLFLHLLDKH